MLKKILVDIFGIGTRTISQAEGEEITRRAVAEFKSTTAENFEKIKQFAYA